MSVWRGQVNRWHKKFISRVHPSGGSAGAPFSEAEQAEGFACFDTEDFREGCAAAGVCLRCWCRAEAGVGGRYQAFLEKRTPAFRAA